MNNQQCGEILEHLKHLKTVEIYVYYFSNILHSQYLCSFQTQKSDLYYSTSPNNAKPVMARKRQFHEIEDFDSVEQPIPSASLHGIVTSLSPLKKGVKSAYFDGTVSDGTSKLRVVGFSTKQQKLMEDFMVKKQPIQLTDCEVKRARRGDQMELLLKTTTAIHGSPKKIEVLSAYFEDNKTRVITLEGLQVIDTYSRMTADVKVEKICEQKTTSSGKKNKMCSLLMAVRRQKSLSGRNTSGNWLRTAATHCKTL